MTAVLAERPGTAIRPRYIPSIELDLLLRQWAIWQRAQGNGARTIADRHHLIVRITTRVGCDPVHASAMELARGLDGPISAGTKQTYYSTLKSWFNWLQAMGLRPDNPCDLLPTPRTPRRRPKPIATGHLEILLGTRMHRRTRTMILLAAYQGLRVHEISKIRGEDVDLISKQLRVVGKGQLDSMLPLHPVIAQEARRYPRRGFWFPTHVGNVQGHGKRPADQSEQIGPILPGSVSTIVGNVMRRAEIPGTPHSLRHWYGTELVRSGANLRIAQELLRHASLQTTAGYVQVADEETAAAILQLPRVGVTP